MFASADAASWLGNGLLCQEPFIQKLLHLANSICCQPKVNLTAYLGRGWWVGSQPVPLRQRMPFIQHFTP